MKQYIKPETTKVELSEDIAAAVCGQIGTIKASNANAKYSFTNYYKHKWCGDDFLQNGSHFFRDGYCITKSRTVTFNGGDNVVFTPKSFTDTPSENGWRSDCSFIGDITVNGKLQ